MSLDPGNYDLGELRTAAGDEFAESAADAPAGDADEESPDAPDPDTTVRRRERSRDLLALGTAVGGRVEQPYLERIPATQAAEHAVLDWLDFLLTVGGGEGAREALAYYERVGWTTESVHERLVTYLDGFSAAHEGGRGRMTTDDHRESLAFVARLRALDGPDCPDPTDGTADSGSERSADDPNGSRSR